MKDFSHKNMYFNLTIMGRGELQVWNYACEKNPKQKGYINTNKYNHW